jgi:hypothetical protein
MRQIYTGLIGDFRVQFAIASLDILDRYSCMGRFNKANDTSAESTAHKA